MVQKVERHPVWVLQSGPFYTNLTSRCDQFSSLFTIAHKRLTAGFNDMDVYFFIMLVEFLLP